MDRKIFTMICAYMRILFAQIIFARISQTLRQILPLSLFFALGGGFLGNTLHAKEPANWLFGVGFGAGLNQIDLKYPDAARNKLGIQWDNWIDVYDSNIKNWGFVWELLVGYKHFLNDYVGFRYYANIGGESYKEVALRRNATIYTTDKFSAGVYEYTANADLLLNFYNSEFWTFGILAGFGVGGAYFDSPALDTYKSIWSEENPNYSDTSKYKGISKVKKHHLSASISIGARFNILQKIRNIGQRICLQGEDGRRTCKVPISYLEHSIELNAKFPMLTYYATDKGDVIGAVCSAGMQCAGKYATVHRRPGIEVKNPYKITLRYVFAF